MDKNFEILNDIKNCKIQGGSLLPEKDWLAKAMDLDLKMMSPDHADGIHSKKAICIFCNREFVYWCNTPSEGWECTYNLWRNKACRKCMKKQKVY